MNSIPLNGKNSSVLVVDDEPGMRTALQANFQRHGWRVANCDRRRRRHACFWSTQALIWS